MYTCIKCGAQLASHYDACCDHDTPARNASPGKPVQAPELEKQPSSPDLLRGAVTGAIMGPLAWIAASVPTAYLHPIGYYGFLFHIFVGWIGGLLIGCLTGWIAAAHAATAAHGMLWGMGIGGIGAPCMVLLIASDKTLQSTSEIMLVIAFFGPPGVAAGAISGLVVGRDCDRWRHENAARTTDRETS